MQKKRKKHLSGLARATLGVSLMIVIIVAAKIITDKDRERKAEKTNVSIVTLDIFSKPVPAPVRIPDTILELEIEELSVELLYEEENTSIIIAQGMNFNDFFAFNSKTAGIISIPGTPIFLPFCVSENDDEWMKTSFDERKSAYGTIFLDYRNEKDLSCKIITLFGHNMRDGKMFANLNNYLKPDDYHTNHDYAFISTGEYIHIYKFACASKVLDENIKPLREASLETEEDYNQYLSLLEPSIKIEDENVELNDAQQILQLITCCKDDDYRSMIDFKYLYSIPNVLSCNETTEEIQDYIAEVTKKRDDFRSIAKNIISYNIPSDRNYIFIENNNGEKFIWTQKELKEEEKEEFISTYTINNEGYMFIYGEGYFNLNGTYINISMQEGILLICEESSLSCVRSGVLTLYSEKSNELKLVK